MTAERRIFGNRHRDYDPVWHVQLAVALALVLQLALPDRFADGPKYVLVALEAALLLFLVITTPRLPEFRSVARRVNALGLIALVSAANIYSLARGAKQLLAGGGGCRGAARV